MSNTNKCRIETPCSTCNHNGVCSHKEEYEKILKSVSNACVELPCEDEKNPSMKKVVDFDFVGDISVSCRHYQNWTDVYRDVVVNI